MPAIIPAVTAGTGVATEQKATGTNTVVPQTPPKAAVVSTAANPSGSEPQEVAGILNLIVENPPPN